MIKYLENNEIDREKWDKCILNSVNGIAYAYSWYLDIIHEDWCGLVEGDYEIVMPLTLKTKYGITYFYQPYFAQQLGVFSVPVLNPEIVNRFIQAIPMHIRLMDFNLNHFNKVDPYNYQIKENTNYMLDLISDYSKLSSVYSTNTKRNLKKSEKSNLSFLKGVDPEEIISLFRANRGADLKNWNDANYATLSRLMYKVILKGMGAAYGVYTEFNELCAAAFFVKTNSRMIFLFSGTNDIARGNGAMTFLIDNVIRNNSPGTRILDFEGSNNENLARFYKGFGAQKTYYQRLKINRLNPVMKILLRLFH